MHEAIVSYLREHPEGVSSQLLAQLFLKFKNPDANLAHTAISAILRIDSRCFVGNENIWRATVKKKAGAYLLEMPLTVMYCLSDPKRLVNNVFFISLWDITSKQDSTYCSWLVDPQRFVSEGEDFLLEGVEFYDKDIQLQEIVYNINQKLENRIPVFLSSHDHSLVRNLFRQHGYYLTDDILLVSELFKAADLTLPRPLTFQSFLNALNILVIAQAEVRKAGESFASGIMELIGRIIGKGIETREEMEVALSRDNSVYFAGKEFSEKTIQSLPATPGVYGFKNQSGVFIYIGKAKNLKRRLMGYFRDTDESPEKIKLLRSESYALTTFQCGSELEALIYEYRLIRKHAPKLNSMIDISERDGTYRSIQDSIIILPHANSDKVMTFWIRENQKILMKPIETINFQVNDYIVELKGYFFETVLPAEPTDFPEIELATRWIKSHRDCLQVIEVYNCADSQEVAELLGFSINETQREKSI